MSSSPLSRFAVLLLTLVVTVCPQVHAFGKRISQIKCDAFQRETKLIREAIPLTFDADPLIFESFNCSKTVDLIVGGEDVKVGEFPHQALLGWKMKGASGYNFPCGGSLISERFVLTAAHCMSKGPPDLVRLGETDLTADSGDEWDAGVKFVKRHPLHRFNSSYHDIALIMLNETILFSAIIRPACLWQTLNETSSPVIATGFGNTEHAAASMSNTLRKVQLNFLDRGECEQQYRGNRKFRQGIWDSQLCIGNVREQESRDACQGDSGGPVQIITEPKGCTYHVLGVTSHGAICGSGRSPSIYTRVASYIEWIEEVVWGEG
ncbi:serine protease snake-like [Culex pipiens pallens]|uniref:serine protease snake-like n=1 Tax=Culex pipiens pallens TaxID=42434 RepID=UPI0019543D80|nr:serine protease snake-like [Culex pipiens pallens]